MQAERHVLTVQVQDGLVLDAGWWEEAVQEDGMLCRVVHAPQQTMFEQLLAYLETVVEDGSETVGAWHALVNFKEQALATMAVCVRWGSYFAVLADHSKPMWSMTEREGCSLIEDGEMARVNIEASAALAQWIELMRADYPHYCALARAAARVPMWPRYFRRTAHLSFYKNIRKMNHPVGRADFLAWVGPREWVERESREVMAYPTRVLANGIINTWWRNKSSIENIHAGRRVEVPLTRRRVTLEQEEGLVRETSEWLVPTLETVYDLVHEQSSDDWHERVLPFHFLFKCPNYWSLTEQTREVVLGGREPG